MAESAENRGAPRLGLRLPCRVRVPALTGPESKASLRNLSYNGACVEGAFAAEPGDELSLTFQLSGTVVTDAKARVVWAKASGERREAGVDFEGRLSDVVKKALLRSGSQTLLVVEDDASTRRALEGVLRSGGYGAVLAHDLATAKRLFSERPFDAVLVDLSLPDGNGMGLVEFVRAHPTRRDTPLLVLTADARLDTKLTGLSLGADHYLQKPCDGEELVFWIAALLRRAHAEGEAAGALSVDGWTIDPESHVVRLPDREVRDLTRKEFDLLYHLIAARPRALSKRYILSKLWHTVLTDNTVEVHIRRIRIKLGEPAAARVVTIPGKGYTFR
ncbi:MAG: response regulator [Elusimicrobia bacterium]|nr:response regulator [Elusimicrobiota bacterium]